MINPYTVEELREQLGLEIFPDISYLSGKNAERRVCRRRHHAELLGIQVGQVLAMPPENPHPKLTVSKPKWRRIDGALEWTYRFETGCWQADIFLDVRPRYMDNVLDAEPIYTYFNALSGVEPHIIKAMQETSPWPQQHETFNSTIKTVLRYDQRAQAPRGLYQRYS